MVIKPEHIKASIITCTFGASVVVRLINNRVVAAALLILYGERNLRTNEIPFGTCSPSGRNFRVAAAFGYFLEGITFGYASKPFQEAYVNITPVK